MNDVGTGGVFGSVEVVQSLVYRGIMRKVQVHSYLFVVPREVEEKAPESLEYAFGGG